MSTENMVKAGKGGLTFASDWDSTIEYDRLTGVRYDNKLFFSKKPVPIGLIPEDGEYWFLAYEGLTDEQWEALLNGTQQVGDSAKLGGKGAELYALLTELANYLSRDGGSLYGSVTVETVSEKEIVFALNNANRRLRFVVQSGGDGGIYDSTNGAWVFLTKKDGTNTFNGTASGNLPLSGGTVASTSANPLYVHRTNGTNIWVGYKGNNEILGFLGFSGLNNPVFAMADGTIKQLLHIGNKPSGSYTGNGDATERIINIGGIGSAVILYSSLKRRMAIVTRGLTLCVDENGAVTADFGTDLLDMSTSLKLSIASTHVCLNENGTAYGYLVV